MTMKRKNFRRSHMAETMGTEMSQDKKTITKAKLRTYLFEFGTDEQTYSVSFRGKIPSEEVRKMLKAIQNLRYENMAEGVLKYLNQNYLEYRDFAAKTVPLEHETVMKYADSLIQSNTCKMIDNQIKETDIYFGIMDHQCRIHNNICEGCYYAMTKNLSEQMIYQYKMIAQTFLYDGNSDREQGSFAIRTGDNHRAIHTIAAVNGEPVIPTFGCIDMMGLLLNIDNIKTAKQAGKIAAK